MKTTYIYPAVFTFGDDAVEVQFPDLPGCVTFGATQEEALSAAEEALEVYLYTLAADGQPFPAPSAAVAAQEAGAVVVLVRANMLRVRMEQENQAERKMVSVPRWLVRMADERGISLSAVLQAGLKSMLGLDAGQVELFGEKRC